MKTSENSVHTVKRRYVPRFKTPLISSITPTKKGKKKEAARAASCISQCIFLTPMDAHSPEDGTIVNFKLAKGRDGLVRIWTV